MAFGTRSTPRLPGGVTGLLGQISEGFALGSAALGRSSAARAAHRDARPLPHLFRASYSCAFDARTLGAWLQPGGAAAAISSISKGANKGARRYLRRDWPETDVGAALRRDAPRGRRSISQAPHIARQAPQTTKPATRQANSCRDMVEPVLCVYCNLCSPTLLCASVAPNGFSQPDSFCCSVPALKNPAPSSA